MYFEKYNYFMIKKKKEKSLKFYFSCMSGRIDK